MERMGAEKNNNIYAMKKECYKLIDVFEQYDCMLNIGSCKKVLLEEIFTLGEIAGESFFLGKDCEMCSTIPIF